MYRYFNVSPCYAMEDAQRRDIRGRAEARVTAFRRARNLFSPSRGIKFFPFVFWKQKKFGEMDQFYDFVRLLLLYMYIH